MIISTYCRGYSLKAYKNITKQDFIELLNNLQKRFNELYNTTDYSFSPEPITEGGIVFNNLDYKTMRLYFTDKNVSVVENNLYGWINENVKEEWKSNEDILIKLNSYLGTTLKSFHSAPQWTNNELVIFIECFYDIGLSLYKTPKKKTLKTLKTIDDPEYYINLFKNLHI